MELGRISRFSWWAPRGIEPGSTLIKSQVLYH